ncbi:MAG: EscU/YscU/HrcU family type III secretion system export apparatus switch protein [Clostridiales bacterium]|jgi:flagellar biosynthesis protein|nr:EscU/YscU/HrcU family type III secretion system export apparatus switch protein [Clostridiales bacterium]
MSRKKFNPYQRAVALKYSPGDVAPSVVAKGTGYVAERILEKGEASDIPVYKDPELASELTRLEIGENIPPELYEVVAQVLIFISDLDRMEEYRRGTGINSNEQR